MSNTLKNPFQPRDKKFKVLLVVDIVFLQGRLLINDLIMKHEDKKPGREGKGVI